MFPPDAIAATAAVFIAGMLWLRTRLHYRADSGARLTLTASGAGYFAAFGALLALGWWLAPWLAARLAPGTALASSFARVLWFLGCYYLFIPLHRALGARTGALFR